MTDNSEVFFNIEMVSLPIGGMITRIACGSTTRKRAKAGEHPERIRGFVLAGVH